MLGRFLLYYKYFSILFFPLQESSLVLILRILQFLEIYFSQSGFLSLVFLEAFYSGVIDFPFSSFSFSHSSLIIIRIPKTTPALAIEIKGSSINFWLTSYQFSQFSQLIIFWSEIFQRLIIHFHSYLSSLFSIMRSLTSTITHVTRIPGKPVKEEATSWKNPYL